MKYLLALGFLGVASAETCTDFYAQERATADAGERDPFDGPINEVAFPAKAKKPSKPVTAIR